MKVAFYAPMKPVDHRVASGDRQFARALLAALRRGGHDVGVASRFRSYDGGDAARQLRLRGIGERLAGRLVARYRRTSRPDAWFTYHLYHKAPDWLGPAVCAALEIPYIVAEASVSACQAQGRWALGDAASRAAIGAADIVVNVNPRDSAGVRGLRGDRGGDTLLAPFIDVGAFDRAAAAARAARGADRPVRLVSVAMMRDGAKLASYRMLARALMRIDALAWELTIVGDGAARPDVQRAFGGLGPSRVTFAGAMSNDALPALLGACDIFVWPAIDEAFGMAFIEAQACGLPVVSGRSQGVASVIADGVSGWLTPPGDAAAFADAVARLVADGAARLRMGEAARAYVARHHDLPAASAALDRVLDDARTRRSRAQVIAS